MADNKKILLVSNTLWSIYHFRFFIIEALIDEGFEVAVLAPPGNTEEKFRNKPGLQYIPLKSMQPKGMSPWNDYRLYSELKEKYRLIDPGLIIHYTVKPNIYGCLAAKATGHKAIAVVTGKGYTLMKKGILQSVVRMLYRRAFDGAKEVWFLNEGDRNWFVQKSILPERQTFILPGEGIDTSHYRRDDHRPPASSKTVFLMIARILRSKGVSEYAEAAGRILKTRDDAEFRLLGRYEEHIPDAVDKETFSGWILNKHIIYFPYTEDVKNMLLHADCFVLPSYSEGLSISLMEAASMELPVIVSDIPGCRELIKEGISGFLVPPGDAGALADRIEDFLALTADQRSSMGREGRRLIAEKYDQHIISRIYKEKIRQWLPDQ